MPPPAGPLDTVADPDDTLTDAVPAPGDKITLATFERLIGTPENATVDDVTENASVPAVPTTVSVELARRCR